MKSSHHNTTNLSGQPLDEAISKAEKQQDTILAFFQRNPGLSFTPLEVHRILSDDKWPETSTRRAMSNLTKQGWLEKTEEKFTEKYGSSNYKWKLLVKPGQQELFK